MQGDKFLGWVGPARREMQALPDEARQAAGRELRRVQQGRSPRDWKPMEEVGPGACEIRIRTDEGGTVQHRVIYVAKFAEAVYVLHAFEKKAQRTPPHHLEVARARYRQMMRDRSRENRDDRRNG
jgi:phage-related protein